MNRLLKFLPLIAFLVGGIASAAKTETFQVTVLSDIPSTNTYNWSISGGSTTSCYGNTCSSNWSDPSSGTAQVKGATLKLLLPDGRIAVAECDMKPDVGQNFAIAIAAAMNNQTATTIYRDCRVPETGLVITAQFKKNHVKLFMRDPSIDGTGKRHSETYQIIGLLDPAPSNSPPTHIVATARQDITPKVIAKK